MPRKHFSTQQGTTVRDLATGKAVEYNTRQIVSANIRYYRKKKGLSQQELAQMIGVTNNAISNWEKGVARPDIDHIPVLCRTLSTNPNRLFGMSVDISKEEEGLLNALRHLGRTERQSIRDLALSLLRAQQMRNRPRPALHLIPIAVKPAAAGIGDPTEYYADSDENQMYVRDNPHSLNADCIYVVNGESMEPTYEDGDKVYVKITNEIYPGQIGIFSEGNELYIKEYQHDGLHSHNPRFKTIEFNEFRSIVTIGVVIGVVEKKDIPSSNEIDLYREFENEETE